MTGIDSCGALSQEEKARLSYATAGAIMLFRKNLNTSKAAIQKGCADINSCYGALKPFIAVDNEGGNVWRLGAEIAVPLPAPASYFQTAAPRGFATFVQIEHDAKNAARAMHELGINLNLAPVVEVLDDDNVSFLGARSYGRDADFVVDASLAFIRGMSAGSVACVIKHFPGNSSADPHKTAPRLDVSSVELENMARPFYEVMRHYEPAAVMVSHVIVSEWDASRNASLSPLVIEKLRRGVGHADDAGGGDEGAGGAASFVLADDFSMGAISGAKSTEEYCVEAINAGCDMIMAWPKNLRSIHAALLAAIRNGTLPRSRARDAAAKIIAQKIRYGVIDAASQ
jgi:beta-N-acetylhexosaminidase